MRNKTAQFNIVGSRTNTPAFTSTPVTQALGLALFPRFSGTEGPSVEQNIPGVSLFFLTNAACSEFSPFPDLVTSQFQWVMLNQWYVCLPFAEEKNKEKSRGNENSTDTVQGMELE